VAEILERTDKQPISFAEEARRRRSVSPAGMSTGPQLSTVGTDLIARFERLGSARYLLLAVVAAVLALVVSDLSPLLANILAIVCVAAIFIPVIQRFRQPDTGMSKTWRGRDMSIGASRPAGIERVFDRFRKPPRL
jgi:hypothetical protein